MFGCPEFSYHQTYSARDWLSILRTPSSTQNLQKKYRTDLHMQFIYYSDKLSFTLMIKEHVNKHKSWTFYDGSIRIIRNRDEDSVSERFADVNHLMPLSARKCFFLNSNKRAFTHFRTQTTAFLLNKCPTCPPTRKHCGSRSRGFSTSNTTFRLSVKKSNCYA